MGSNKKTLTILLLNILAMVVIGILLIFLTLYFLKIYTKHNDAVTVPDLNGLTEVEAMRELEKLDLYLEVTDSVYNNSEPRGVILEYVPAVGSKIKRNRYVYATINSKQVAMKKIPRVFEVSMRQAEALLMSNGFVDVKIKYVGGAYRDLALRVTDERGRELKEGDKVPYNQPLILEVTSDDPALFQDSLLFNNNVLDTDSAAIQEQLDDNFF